MADMIGKTLGNEGVAEVIGKQAGRVVEEGVKKVISGNKSQEAKKKAGGAGGAEGAGGGGLDVRDVINFGSGQKDNGAGGGLGKAVGGLFK